MLERISINDLLDLVKTFSIHYRDCEAFRISLSYFTDYCNLRDRVKYVLYQELCESIGEDFANIEIENKLSE